MSITKISPDVVDFDSTLTLTAADTDTVDSVSNAHLVLTDDGDTAYWKVRMGTTNRYLGIDGLDSSTWKEVIAFDRTEQRVGVGTSPDYKMHIFTADSGASAHANSDDLFIENSGNAGITIGSGTTSNGSIFFSDSDSSLSGQIEYRHNGDSLYFYTGGGSRLRVDSDGLKFGSDTATANALDDYEEGTWTPGIGEGAVTVDRAYYTKIGRLVHIAVLLSGFTNRTSTNSVVVNNLPFNVLGDTAAGTAMANYNDATNAQCAYVTTAEVLYFYTISSGGYDNMTHDNLNNSSSSIYFFATYTSD